MGREGATIVAATSEGHTQHLTLSAKVNPLLLFSSRAAKTLQLALTAIDPVLA
jgi:hypothetical protein